LSVGIGAGTSSGLAMRRGEGRGTYELLYGLTEIDLVC
jgi:hypothetical protein